MLQGLATKPKRFRHLSMALNRSLRQGLQHGQALGVNNEGGTAMRWLHIHRGAKTVSLLIDRGTRRQRPIVPKPTLFRRVRTLDHDPNSAQLGRLYRMLTELADALNGKLTKDQLDEYDSWLSQRPGAADDPVAVRGKRPTLQARVQRWFYALPARERLQSAYALRDKYQRGQHKSEWRGSNKAVEKLLGDLKKLDALVEERDA